MPKARPGISGFVSLGTARRAPGSQQTLVDALDWHANAHGERPHLLLSEGDEVERVIPYGELHTRARQVAGWLLDRGIAEGDRVAIMLPTCEGFFFAFYGVLHAGAVPVPIYPPTRKAGLEEHLRRQAGILRNAGAAALITFPEARRLAALLRAHVPSIMTVATVEEMRSDAVVPARRGPEATALIQYTSGSTGAPKGVVLSHENLLANIRAVGEGSAVCESDRFVSWLPLYHDMGLIGAWLSSLYYALPVLIMSPLSFLSRPERWLWAIHHQRGTMSAAPNFAFEFCLKRLSQGAFEGLDLRSLRWLANGAESVRASTIRRFIEGFAPYGLRPEALTPVYGLAESTVGLAFTAPGRRARIHRVQRAALSRRHIASEAEGEDVETLEFVGCGQPLPDHEVRVVDATGRELGERHEGQLQFRGPSATTGYFRNPEATRQLRRGDWLESGDLAYLADGEIFITGRLKDVILRGGRNLYPEQIEEAVSTLSGVRKGCVAAFAVPDPHAGSERLVVVAETRLTDSEEQASLRERIRTVTAELLELPADDVVLTSPHSIPKTSSGKLRRAAARELYQAGTMGTAPTPVAWQLLRLALEGARPTVRRGLDAGGALLYAGHWWAAMGLATATAWPAVVLWTPGSARWRALERAARRFFWVTKTPIETQGLDGLPGSPCVLVVNHASYIDGLVLAAVLPRAVRFVAKRELADRWFTRRFFRQLGTVFVERFETEQALEDARKLAEAATGAVPLVVFPEGTLTRRPGLSGFHMGAFVAAAQAGVPVVPVGLCGTRSLLRGDQWFPRRTPLSVRFGAPIEPEGTDWAAATKLRDAARQALLELTGEPDLAGFRSSRGPE